MSSTPFYSIVMPIYKGEKYIMTAANCLLNQTYEDLELILVNDGSPDNSPALCDELARRDARVKVIHLAENMGASAARNAGMDAACGKYLMFMDCDDETEHDILGRAAMHDGADVVVWGIIDEYMDDQEQIYKTAVHTPREAAYTSADAVRRALIDLEQDTLLGYIHNKVYKRSTVRASGARFENRLVTEDIFFNLHQCDAWNTMVCMDYPAQHYRHRSNHTSITGRYVPDFFEQNRGRVAELLSLYESWNLLDAHVLCVLGNILTRYLFSAIERLYDPRAQKTHAERRAFLHTQFTADPLFARVIPYSKPDGCIARVMSSLLKAKNITLCLLIGRTARFTRTKLPNLFTRLRQSR